MNLPVAPNRRRHVMGPGGEALRTILQEYKEVRVVVPPTENLEAQHIAISGPEDQVSAVAAAITRHLQEVEVKLREAQRVKQDKKRADRAARPRRPAPRTLADFFPPLPEGVAKEGHNRKGKERQSHNKY